MVVQPGVSARRLTAAPAPVADTALLAMGQDQVDAMRATIGEAVGVEHALLEQRSQTAETANSVLVGVLVWASWPPLPVGSAWRC